MGLPVLEASERVGGVVRTTHEPFFFEQGPRTFQLGRSPALLHLCQELGLPILKGQMGTRWLYSEAQFTNMLDVKRLYMGLIRDLVARRGPHDETIAEFGARRFGKKITETVLRAMVRGIYAGDIDHLSIRECFPKLKEMEERYRSIMLGQFRSKRGEKGLFTLQGGMETLTKALARQVQTSRPVYRLEPTSNGVIVNEEKFDHVYCALPAKAMQSLAWDETSQRVFQSMTFESITTVNIAFAKNVLPFEGFGYLTPHGNVMGVVFDSSIFPEQNTHSQETRLTVMLKSGGEKEALHALRTHLNITAPIDYMASHTYQDVLPNYTTNHRARIQSLSHPHLTLLGNYVDGPAFNTCIQTTESLASTDQDIS